MFKTKYDRLISELEATGTGKMKCFGNSMLPILKNPSMCTYQVQPEYDVGDIVFCKVRGRYIDAHKVTKKKDGLYLISNNHGHDNGWTNKIYAKVIVAEYKDQICYF